MVFITSSEFFPFAYLLLHKMDLKLLKSISDLIIIQDTNKKLTKEFLKEIYLSEEDSINKLRLQIWQSPESDFIFNYDAALLIKDISNEKNNLNNEKTKHNYREYLKDQSEIYNKEKNSLVNNMMYIINQSNNTFSQALGLSKIEPDFMIRNEILNNLMKNHKTFNYSDSINRFQKLISKKSIIFFVMDAQSDIRLYDILNKSGQTDNYQNLVGYHNQMKLDDTGRYFQIYQYLTRMRKIIEKSIKKSPLPVIQQEKDNSIIKHSILLSSFRGILRNSLEKVSNQNKHSLIGGGEIYRDYLIDYIFDNNKYISYYDLDSDTFDLRALSNKQPSVLLNANESNFNKDR